MSSFERVQEQNDSGDIDLGEIAQALRRHWRKIATTTLFFTVAAVVYVLFAVPKFSLTGSLYLGDARGTAPQTASTDLNYLSDYQAVSDVETLVEMLKSKGLIEQAILESGLNAPVKREDTAPINVWRWVLLHGHAMNAYAPQPGDLQAADVTFSNAPDQPVPFNIVMGEHGKYDVFSPGGWFFAAVPVASGQLGVPASGGGLSLLLTPAIPGAMPPAGTKFVMKVSAAESVEARLMTSGALNVSAGGIITNPTKIANLQFTAENPYAGRQFLSQLMNDFITTQVAWNNQAASTDETFIANQLSGIKASLLDADQKLAAFQSQSGILDVPENAQADIGQLSQYETQRTAIALQQEALQQLASEIAHPAGSLNPYLLSQVNDTVLSQLATNLANEEAKLEALQMQFTENSPDVRVEEGTIAQIKNTIKSVVGNELAATQNNLVKMDAVIAQYNAKLKNMPAESLQVIGLTRASDVYGRIYVLLMQKEEEAEVSKAAQIVGTRVMTPPEIPQNAVSPRPVLIIVSAFFIGLFGGIFTVVMQQSLSGRFQSEDEINRSIKLPVYGIIPHRPELEQESSILLPNPQTPFAEAVRMLRSSIYRAGAGDARVVLLSSSGMDDGKTTIAMNLAKMLADGGKKVILIDADLHKGRLHEFLKVEPFPGLTEWLTSRTAPRFQTVPGQRFVLLPTGILPPNPSELMNEPYLGNIISALRETFDYVVIDSPPLPAVSDGLILGELADLVLSLVMVGHTSRQVFAVHNDMISSLDRRHGLIINGIAGNAYGYGYAVNQESKLTKFLRAVERA